jgi:hypothetical protein
VHCTPRHHRDGCDIAALTTHHHTQTGAQVWPPFSITDVSRYHACGPARLRRPHTERAGQGRISRDWLLRMRLAREWLNVQEEARGVSTDSVKPWGWLEREERLIGSDSGNCVEVATEVWHD